MTGFDDPLPPPARSKTSTPLLTVEEVADILRITPGAVRVRQHRGTGPPSVRVGRRRLFPRSSFDEWISENETRNQ